MVGTGFSRLLLPKNRKSHIRNAGPQHTEAVRRCPRNIYNAPPDKGTAVIDADYHGAVISDIGHPHARVKGQRRMRCRQVTWIEPLAAGGRIAGEAKSIVTGTTRTGTTRTGTTRTGAPKLAGSDLTRAD